MGYTVVWFKRDLRVHDHAPLAHAAAHGPVLCLYVLEPSLWMTLPRFDVHQVMQPNGCSPMPLG